MQPSGSPSRLRAVLGRVVLWGSLGLASGLAALGGLRLARHLPSLLDASTPSPTQQSQPEVEALAAAAVTWTAPPSGAAAPDAPLRFIALGGGYTPESNEVSLEQDIELLQRTLPGPGRVLFAGGGASPTVRELDPAPRGDPVELALGELILPLGGRNSHYRAARFEAQPATEPNVRATPPGSARAWPRV